ncbi:IS110 family transposase [Lentilactobacillus sp. Marseille-Q4993]|uniref:IS110 family transposase n=1 Tax=Lentilactobacillus sp. Marseille-Q4993 TaxID=3039492 RepID=UPI0024BCFD13|nr:IS110 family transposase [Lentilactobacillus sp. Marseille-Q4993]
MNGAVLLLPQKYMEGDKVHILGIDVSRGKSSCALLNDHRIIKEFKIVHNKQGLAKLKSIIKDSSPVLSVFETTGIYSKVLTTFFTNENFEYLEINPLESSIRMASLRRQKTDRSDAVKLALLGIEQKSLIHGRRPYPKRYERLHLMAHRYLEITKERSRTINHLHAALEQSFPELNDLFKPIRSVLGLTFVKLYPHPDFLIGDIPETMAKRVTSLVSHKIHLDLIKKRCVEVWNAGQISYPAVPADSFMISQIQAYCDEINQYNKMHELLKQQLIDYANKFPEFRLITSIPGAGEISTALMMGFTGDIKRFSSYKQLNAYIGIDLRRVQSGDIKKADRINRRGQNSARYIMFEMIRSMLKNKARFDNHIVDYYYKQKSEPNPKPDLVAMIACVNRLDRTIMNLVCTNQAYDYEKTSH